MQTRKSSEKIIQILNKKYGDVPAFLNHSNVFEFLLAVILSAQTTDILVNKVTPALFKKYPNAKSLKKAKFEDVDKLVHSVNYHPTKAKHLIETARIIDEEFDGKVPNTMEDLLKLPGVGRKVANVILSDFHKIPEGFVVDTHIKRVSYRVGWTKSTNPTVIEKDLMKMLTKEAWISAPRQLILIGRQYCFPKNPNCKECPLNSYCEKNGVVQTIKNVK